MRGAVESTAGELELEHASACPLCHATNADLAWCSVAGYQLRRCARCAFLYVTPRPTDEALATHYNTDYFMARQVSSGAENPRSTAQARRAALAFHHLIRELHPSAVRVCEIGCSFGYLLRDLRDLGYQVKGYELSPTTATFGREHLGLDIESGTFPKEARDEFDVVIMRHVLEHVKEPRPLLENVLGSLRSRGIAIIVGPNSHSLNSRLFGRHCSWIAPPDHLSYFTPTTLTILLKLLGYEPAHSHTELGRGVNVFLGFALYLISASGRKATLKEQIGGVGDADAPGPAGWLKRGVRIASGALYWLSWPIWRCIDRIGMGEELWVVGQKPSLG